MSSSYPPPITPIASMELPQWLCDVGDIEYSSSSNNTDSTHHTDSSQLELSQNGNHINHIDGNTNNHCADLLDDGLLIQDVYADDVFVDINNHSIPPQQSVESLHNYSMPLVDDKIYDSTTSIQYKPIHEIKYESVVPTPSQPQYNNTALYGNTPPQQVNTVDTATPLHVTVHIQCDNKKAWPPRSLTITSDISMHTILYNSTCIDECVSVTFNGQLVTPSTTVNQCDLLSDNHIIFQVSNDAKSCSRFGCQNLLLKSSYRRACIPCQNNGKLVTHGCMKIFTCHRNMLQSLKLATATQLIELLDKSIEHIQHWRFETNDSTAYFLIFLTKQDGDDAQLCFNTIFHKRHPSILPHQYPLQSADPDTQYTIRMRSHFWMLEVNAPNSSSKLYKKTRKHHCAHARPMSISTVKHSGSIDMTNDDISSIATNQHSSHKRNTTIANKHISSIVNTQLPNENIHAPIKQYTTTNGDQYHHNNGTNSHTTPTNYDTMTTNSRRSSNGYSNNINHSSNRVHVDSASLALMHSQPVEARMAVYQPLDANMTPGSNISDISNSGQPLISEQNVLVVYHTLSQYQQVNTLLQHSNDKFNGNGYHDTNGDGNGYDYSNQYNNQNNGNDNDDTNGSNNKRRRNDDEYTNNGYRAYNHSVSQPPSDSVYAVNDGPPDTAEPIDHIELSDVISNDISINDTNRNNNNSTLPSSPQPNPTMDTSLSRDSNDSSDLRDLRIDRFDNIDETQTRDDNDGPRFGHPSHVTSFMNRSLDNIDLVKLVAQQTLRLPTSYNPVYNTLQHLPWWPTSFWAIQLSKFWYIVQLIITLGAFIVLGFNSPPSLTTAGWSLIVPDARPANDIINGNFASAAELAGGPTPNPPPITANKHQYQLYSISSPHIDTTNNQYSILLNQLITSHTFNQWYSTVDPQQITESILHQHCMDSALVDEQIALLLSNQITSQQYCSMTDNDVGHIALYNGVCHNHHTISSELCNTLSPQLLHSQQCESLMTTHTTNNQLNQLLRTSAATTAISNELLSLQYYTHAARTQSQCNILYNTISSPQHNMQLQQASTNSTTTAPTSQSSAGSDTKYYESLHTLANMGQHVQPILFVVVAAGSSGMLLVLGLCLYYMGETMKHSYLYTRKKLFHVE